MYPAGAIVEALAHASDRARSPEQRMLDASLDPHVLLGDVLANVPDAGAITVGLIAGLKLAEMKGRRR